MKHFTILFFLAITTTIFSQETTYNHSGGFIAEGYDVVAYFTKNKAVEGTKEYQATYKSAKFQFSSEENRTLFLDNPKKYTPEYGGWCAYAMGAKATKISIDPETFEIRNGKLYLFYNSWGTNTLKKWLEDPEPLRKKANENWQKIIEK